MTTEKFGLIIKRLRELHDVSQQTLGDALGLSKGAVLKIEKNLVKHLPGKSQIEIIARVLKTNVNTLLGADEFILDRFDAEEQELLMDYGSVDIIKKALAVYKEQLNEKAKRA